MTDDPSPSRSSSVPTPVAPADAVAVDGTEVTFVWEAAPDAERYWLQIAETARFDTLLVDEGVGTETAVTVGNQLPTDGSTLFWRVVAEGPEGDRVPSPVESFIVGTEAEAEQDLLAPEEAGPVTGLARAAKREVSRRVLGAEDRFEEEKRRGVAYEGIAASQIMAIAVSILVVIMVAVVVIFNWYGQVSQDTRASATTPENYELLQRAEMEAMEDLSQYEVVDGEEGVYRIPIEQAMDVVATEEYQRAQATPEETGAANGSDE